MSTVHGLSERACWASNCLPGPQIPPTFGIAPTSSPSGARPYWLQAGRILGIIDSAPTNFSLNSSFPDIHFALCSPLMAGREPLKDESDRIWIRCVLLGVRGSGRYSELGDSNFSDVGMCAGERALFHVVDDVLGVDPIESAGRQLIVRTAMFGHGPVG